MFKIISVLNDFNVFSSCIKEISIFIKAKNSKLVFRLYNSIYPFTKRFGRFLFISGITILTLNMNMISTARNIDIRKTDISCDTERQAKN